MEELNPRSYLSIKKAIQERRAKSRGQLARQMVNAFRAPTIERKQEEAAAKSKQSSPSKKSQG